MSKGILIKKLVITGKSKNTVTIPFAMGLNVVTGASNTGKSYIVECLNFMFGSKVVPKDIPHSKGYDNIYLEIEDCNKKEYTLRRHIAGGKFYIKSGDFHSKNDEIEYQEVLSNETNNISTFLLTACNLNDVKLKKNKRNETTRLSFRDVVGLCLIDEVSIIKKTSPFLSDQYVTKTKEQALFYHLLGVDLELGEVQEDPQIFKSRINGQIEFIKDLLEDAKKKIETYQVKDVVELEAKIDSQLSVLNIEYADTLTKADELKAKRDHHKKIVNKIESDIIFKRELASRFKLLEKHYRSDADRLAFISEGTYLMQQLVDVKCPICGSDIDYSHVEHIKQNRNTNEYIKRSISNEIDKINLKYGELVETIESINSEILKKEEQASKEKMRVLKYDTELNEKLTPIKQSIKERLDEIANDKVSLYRYKRLIAEIDNYSNKLIALEDSLKIKEKYVSDNIPMSGSIFSEFCDIVKSTLTNWNFPGVASVIFSKDSKEFDIRINNLKRESNGKGYRAITYAAAVYSLMEYCYQKDRPHPYFLIMDSPLTTFKENDTVSVEDQIDKSVETSFFNFLSNIDSKYQVIILENKEPEESLKSKINYIHFSGIKDVGREGLFN